MKSFKMKTLSMAVMGFAGLALAGSALAVCPTGATVVNGGAWNSQNVSADATMSIVTPGLNGTSCALQIAIAATPAANARGFVSDNSPQNEPRYRARFYMDLSSMTSLSTATQQFEMFNAFSSTAPGTNSTDEVRIYQIGGTGLRFFVADTSSASGVKVVSLTLPTSAAKKYRVEFDLQTGSPGSFRYWVTDAATTTTDAAPTGTYAPTNSGWSGVLSVNLGLYATTANFRAQVAGPTQQFRLDEFDSRRQTFIGL